MATLGDLLEQKRREDLAAHEQLSQGLQTGSAIQTQQAGQIATAERANRFNPLNTIASAASAFIASGGNPVIAAAAALGGKKGDTDVLGSAAQGAGQGMAGQFLGKAPSLEPLPAGGMAATGAAPQVPVDIISNTMRNIATPGQETAKAGLLQTLGAPEAITKPVAAIGERETAGKLQTITSGLQAIESDVLAGDLTVTDGIKKAKELKTTIDTLPMKASERKEVDTAYNTTLKTFQSQKKESDKPDTATSHDYYDSAGNLHNVVRDKTATVTKVDGKPVKDWSIPAGWSTTKPKDDDGGSRGSGGKSAKDFKQMGVNEFRDQLGLIDDDEQYKFAKENPVVMKKFTDDYVLWRQGKLDDVPSLVDYIPEKKVKKPAPKKKGFIEKAVDVVEGLTHKKSKPASSGKQMALDLMN